MAEKGEQQLKELAERIWQLDEQVYRDLEPADFSYVHNIDPGEMYDVKEGDGMYIPKEERICRW